MVLAVFILLVRLMGDDDCFINIASMDFEITQHTHLLR